MSNSKEQNTRAMPSPLAGWPEMRRAAIRGVFCDIDDTLTREGRVGSDVFLAMEQLQSAGVLVVPITGRPGGWCDMIARQWPVDGVVGENGALYFRYDNQARHMIRVYQDTPEQRARNRAKLDGIAAEVLQTIPGAAIASDQAYRDNDLAIDFSEDVAPLGQSEIDAIVAVFEKHGATAKVSSIHVNGWFGNFDKLTMTRRFMAEVFGVDLDAERGNYCFVGDSPNDAPMFGYFPDAVGVANLATMMDQCPQLPRWISTGGSGAGFVEVANLILKARNR